MTTPSDRSASRKRTTLAAVVVTALLVPIGVGGCAGGPADSVADPVPGSPASSSAPAAPAPNPPTVSDAGDGGREAVRNFYSSKTKHGFATFHSGPQPDERVEFWFDEDGRYRLTWYYPEEETENIDKYGPVRIHMISTDGDTVFYSRPEEKRSEVAPVLAEKQQWTFNGPPNWEPDAGVQDGERTVFTYTPKKLWDVPGSTQQFYLYDMQVHTRSGQVERITMRTSSEKKPVKELVDSQFTIDQFELNPTLPEDVFTLPYPVTGK